MKSTFYSSKSQLRAGLLQVQNKKILNTKDYVLKFIYLKKSPALKEIV